MHFLTKILLCIRIVMQSFGHRLSGVVNVRTFWPRLSDRSWSTFFLPSTQVARSPRSLGLATLMLFSMMCVFSRAVANPDESSSDTYWIFASRGVSVGSGIVKVRHSHPSGSFRSVLSSSLSTGVSCCIIFFLDLGWISGGDGELDVLVSGWFSGGAADIASVLCRFFGVRPNVLYLLGVLWLPCVICAQLAVLGSCGRVRFVVVWLGCLYLVGVFCPLDVTCA